MLSVEYTGENPKNSRGGVPEKGLFINVNSYVVLLVVHQVRSQAVGFEGDVLWCHFSPRCGGWAHMLPAGRASISGTHQTLQNSDLGTY